MREPDNSRSREQVVDKNDLERILGTRKAVHLAPVDELDAVVSTVSQLKADAEYTAIPSESPYLPITLHVRPA